MFRIVGVWNEEDECCHLCVTNLSAEEHDAPDIAKLYQARWVVELLFRELKRVYGLDEVTSSKPEVMEALILIGFTLAGGLKSTPRTRRGRTGGQAANESPDCTAEAKRICWQ